MKITMNINIKKTWDDYKVFVLGVAGAVMLAVQEIALQPKIDWKVIGLSGGIAAISYAAKNWRGQSASGIGMLGNSAFAFMTVHQTGHFTWSQFFLQLMLVFGFAFMPDPKSRGYEQTDTIKQAKVEGEIIKPSALTSVAVKEEAKKQEESK